MASSPARGATPNAATRFRGLVHAGRRALTFQLQVSVKYFVLYAAPILLRGKDPILALALEFPDGTDLVLARTQRLVAGEAGQHFGQKGESVRGNLVEDVLRDVVTIENQLVSDASRRRGRQEGDQTPNEQRAREERHRVNWGDACQF